MRGAGRVAFAGIVLLMVGTLNIIYGFGALDDANYFTNDTRFVLDNLNTLGWVLIILGVIQVTAGFSLLSGGTYGRVMGVIGGSLGALGSAVLDGRRQPLVVTLRVRALRVRRPRHRGLRRGRARLLAGSGARPPSRAPAGDEGYDGPDPATPVGRFKEGK